MVCVCICVCARVCARACVCACVKQGMLCLCELPPNDPNACLLQEYQSSLFPAFPLSKKYRKIKKKKKSPYCTPLDCMVLCGCMLAPCTLAVFECFMKWSAVYVRGWGKTSSHAWATRLYAELWVWSRVRKERHLIKFARHEQKWRSVNLIAALYGALAANLAAMLLNVIEVFPSVALLTNISMLMQTKQQAHTCCNFHWFRSRDTLLLSKSWQPGVQKDLWNDNKSNY